ncbi:phage head-tail adapter protein [Staphylococcus delphini]|uniref:phage head-tail adapter protein n=1 Tax=Staphylococcus delphini TaxID=53344 RepID=UPI000BBC2D2C|nr:phage head-tail adapter protein [Staphylococcus delphini]PCF70800.1 phage head-tail adapter protein [Staphylococcus delphini]
MDVYEEVELYLKANGVEITDDERQLFEMEVDGILEDVKDITNNNFIKDGKVTYPYRVKKYVADVIEYFRRPEVKKNLKSRSMGTVSYTYNDGVPEHISNALNRYKRAKFHVYKPLR